MHILLHYNWLNEIRTNKITDRKELDQLAQTLTYKNQILLNKTKHKNEYIHIDIRTFNVS